MITGHCFETIGRLADCAETEAKVEETTSLWSWSLSQDFRPAAALQPTSEPEQEWLDPQLRGESAVHGIGRAVGNRSDTSPIPNPRSKNPPPQSILTTTTIDATNGPSLFSNIPRPTGLSLFRVFPPQSALFPVTNPLPRLSTLGSSQQRIVLVSKAVDHAGGISRHEDDIEEEIGAWSLYTAFRILI